MILCDSCHKSVIIGNEISRYRCEICGNYRFSQFSIKPRMCDVCAVGKGQCQVCSSSISIDSNKQANSLNDKYKRSEFYSKIKGVTFVSGRQKAIQNLVSGQELFFLHEKNNPVDNNAIKLFADKDLKIELGYINKDLSPDLLDFMYNHGIRFSVFVSEVTGGFEDKSFGCNIKIKIYK